MTRSTDFPIAEKIVTNGIELSVHSAGQPGKPIVLCHGWPEIAYSWRYQVQPLVAAGYHVIMPNQRGFADSSCPEDVSAYDAETLSADLMGVLDHFNYQQAVFVGHDWGAILLWILARLHPERVSHLINLSVPFMARGETEWVTFWEKMLGQDFYIVHFNRQPGVAEDTFDAHTHNFLQHIYRTEHWLDSPRDQKPGMPMINMALDTSPPAGKALMSAEELSVFVTAFEKSGFRGGLNWYRNFPTNWHMLAQVPERIEQDTLMIYGEYDVVPSLPNLQDFVPNLQTHTLECGHWIQQEKPEETTKLMLDWLERI